MQNNSAAAINNLRRLGATRGQARNEAQQIEERIARLMQARGFKTVLNWEPPFDVEDPGEVDLIAVLDGHLVVVEVKSTYLRQSKRDAWLHGTTTLRKAGVQLRRKVPAVLEAINANSELRARLGISDESVPAKVHSWIVDTSIEHDHQRFAGFLKISVEEMLIALRDDTRHLRDIDSLFSEHEELERSFPDDAGSPSETLYPNGFSAERFCEVIETAAVWNLPS
jgi:Holliday junction resolvase-like predicted endonuclease